MDDILRLLSIFVQDFAKLQARRSSAPFVEGMPAPPGQAISEGQAPQPQPTATPVPSNNNSSSGSSSGTGSVHTVVGVPQQGGRTAGASGIVRKRSWRLHYTRPKNKSLEYETGNVREVGDT